MQALVLVGGEGTRLRPLTSNVPKPIVSLVDRPFLGYMLEWLVRHGVDDVIVSCGFLATKVREVLGDGSAYGISLRFVEEPEPLGTAGALKYAQEWLADRFLMLNGDTLTDMDLTAQIAQHEATGATATLALVPVDDPSSYGLVRLHDDQRVRGFLEKPSPDQIDTNLISAGAYVLERAVLDLIPEGRNVSIEREVWPKLVDNGLYGCIHRGAYWMDIGTPERYLQGTFDILEGQVASGVRDRMGDGYTVVDPGATVNGRVVPPAVIGRGVTVAQGAHIGSLAVLGPGVQIGDRTEISGGAVVGENVIIGTDNVVSNGARIFPGVTLPDGALKF